jgi:hypothetical protein
VFRGSLRAQIIQSLKNNQDLTHILKDLTKNLKNTSLVIYLETIGRNVDQALYITLPKSDLSLNGWIFVDQGFCKKTQREKVEKIAKDPDLFFFIKKRRAVSFIH